MPQSASPNGTSGAPMKPRLTSTRPSGSHLEIPSAFDGCFSLLQLGADTEAVAGLRRSIEANRSYPLAHFVLAAALALFGEPDQARAAAQAGLTLDPTFTIRRYRVNTPSKHPTFLAARQRLYEGMSLAGVPEG
jgi:hypothetical protein